VETRHVGHEHEDQEPNTERPLRKPNGNRSLSTGLNAFSISSSCTDNGAPIVAPAGEVDLYTVAQLDREIAHAVRSASSRLIIDLASVTFVDSAVIHLLVTVSRECEETGRKLTVVAPDRSVRKVFEITGIDRALSVVDALSDADSR
jgi:anti-sigma B factor antagonist